MNLSESSLTLPSLKEELERKTFATLEWLVLEAKRGAITNKQFQTGLEAVFMVASGLVGKDFLAITTELSSQCDKSAEILRRHFVKSENTRTASWRVGSAEITFVFRTLGEVTSGKSKVYESPELARDAFKAMSFESKGWEEL